MIHVDSEVGRLRRVLIHEPGDEIDRMVPGMMQELLFDDILHGPMAREEHRRFRRVLELLGVEVLEARELLAESLAVPEGRAWIERRVLPDLDPSFRDQVRAMAADRLARALVEGVRRRAPTAGGTLDGLFGVRPLPNWCFQRDTQVVLGRHVHISSMASLARRREATLSRTIFRFHPEFGGVSLLGPEETDGRGETQGTVEGDTHGAHGALEEATPGAPASPSDGMAPVLEGGDVLVLSPDLVAVGESARTTLAGVDALIQQLHGLADGPRWLLRVTLPRERAFMHLDTLFTPVDHDRCLVYPPGILPGFPDSPVVTEYDLHAHDPSPRDAGDLLGALSRRGLDYEPIHCGGDDPVDQQREQWTDGANALALAPGLAVMYDRNLRTAEAMDQAGFRVVRSEDLLLGRDEVRPGAAESVCILTPSSELSRARGGPHCLTHPLQRDSA